MAYVVSELDRCLELIEGLDTGITELCLRMAKMELQIKIHNITDEELNAFRELMETVSRKRELRRRKSSQVP